MIVLSEDGNNKLLEDFHSLEEKTKYVLGRTHLYVYWIKPVCSDDEERNVVGSNIRYAFSGDIGGSIPKYLQNSLGPKTAFDSVQGMIKLVECKRKK